MQLSVPAEACLDELVKIGFGPAEHTQLMERSLSSMGARPTAPMASLGTAGALATDKGIRSPHLPTNPALHAMPGQSRMKILREAAKTRRSAVQDISKSIGRSESPLSGARATRGMMNLGQAQHAYAGDLAAHYEKPLERGISGPKAKTLAGRTRGALRETLPKIPGSSPAAMLLSGAEHAADEGPVKTYVKHKMGKQPAIDALQPEKYQSDVKALSRAESFGKSSQRRVVQNLMKEHGMSQPQAEAAVKKFMEGQAPGRASQTLGRASRNVRFAKGQASRVPRLLSRLLLRH